VTDVVLTTKEHRKNTYRPALLVHIEPVNCSSDRKMPQAGLDVVMPFAAIRRGHYALCGCADLQHTCSSVLNCTFQLLAKIEIAVQKMIEDQSEIVLGLDGELKTVDHGRGACRQPSRRAAYPFLARL